MVWVSIDTYEGGEANVGIASLYIMRVQDDIYLDREYGGDGMGSYGIHTDIKNTWPDHDGKEFEGKDFWSYEPGA